LYGSKTTSAARIRDVYSPDSNDSGIVADHSMTSRRCRHVTNPEPETAQVGDDRARQQQQVGADIFARRRSRTRPAILNSFPANLYHANYSLHLHFVQLNCLPTVFAYIAASSNDYFVAFPIHGRNC